MTRLAAAGLIAFLAIAGVHVLPIAARGPSPATAQGTTPGTGTIEGRVRLTGPAPANPIVRMGLDPLCAKLNPERPRQLFVVRAADGGLANAFVALDGAFAATPVPTTPVTVVQRNCVYTPRVVGARVGQTLRVINGDTLLHNVHSQSAQGNEFNETQPRSDMVFDYVLKSEEQMMRIKCDVHSWMTTYVGVMTHPFFAVSNESGAFTIANVPAGKQTIRLWHERFGKLTQTIDVKPGAVTTVTFELTGTERPTPAAELRELIVPAEQIATR